ncbi:hypothetical protein WMO79_09215 [Micrococcaceae bacterium Sec7.4]
MSKFSTTAVHVQGSAHMGLRSRGVVAFAHHAMEREGLAGPALGAQQIQFTIAKDNGS